MLWSFSAVHSSGPEKQELEVCLMTKSIVSKNSLTAATVREMPIKAYLSAPGMQHSHLQHFAKSAAHFREAVDHPEKPTFALIFGELVHTAVFEPHKLQGCYYIKPETYENKKGEIKPWNGNATECKDWKYAHSDRPIIGKEDFDALIGIRKSVLEHPAARRCMEKGSAELSMFAWDPETKVLLKSRPDWTAGGVLVNLKTTEDASLEGFARSIAKFHYDSAAAFHLDVFQLVKPKEKDAYVFIVVEKSPPYVVGVYNLDQASIQIGREKYRRWLRDYVEAMESDQWPGYSDKIRTISLPMWEIRRHNTQLSLT